MLPALLPLHVPMFVLGLLIVGMDFTCTKIKGTHSHTLVFVTPLLVLHEPQNQN